MLTTVAAAQKKKKTTDQIMLLGTSMETHTDTKGMKRTVSG